MMLRRLMLPMAMVVLLASCGEDPQGPGGTMVITVTQPPEGNVDADSTYTLAWETTGALEGAKVTLMYDVDLNPAGAILIVNNQPATGTYEWMCADVPEGTYYIRASVAVGISNDGDYSAGTITLTHPWAGPRITLLTPPAGGASADSLFTIEWETIGFKDPTISLYLDTDTIPDDTVLIVKGLEDTGSYEWICRNIGAGEYYIYAVANGPEGTDGGFETSVARLPLSSHGSRAPATAEDYSDGILTINHGGELPQITILTPPAAGDTANTEFSIEWTKLALGTTVIDLYYDTDTIPDTGLKLIAAHLPDTLDSYLWDCSAVTEGVYYIYGLIKDVDGNRLGAFRNSGTDYSDGTLTVDHSGGYSFFITEPPAAGASADSLYKIIWNTDAPASAELDLFYSADTIGMEFFEIVTDAPNDGFFNWDCSGTPEGDWYVFGVLRVEADTLLDWSEGRLTIEHSEFTMEVTAPPAEGASADSSYTIEWTASGPDGSVVDLFYDVDDDPTNMTGIASGLDNSGTYEWDTSLIPDGSYFVYATIHGDSDGSGGLLRRIFRDSASDYSDGRLAISHGQTYSIEVTHPPLEGAEADTLYMVKWITDAPDSLKVDLWYSADTVGTEMFLIEADIPCIPEYYPWDTSAVPEGEWYVYAALKTTDGYTDWSPGRLAVTHAVWSMEVTAPPAEGAGADSTYTIEWTALGGAGAVVDLYYDEDTDPTSMTLIRADLANTGSYEWNTLSVSEGDWYVYAVIRPGTTDAPYAVDYSEGALSVTHADFFVLVTAPPEWGAEADSTFTIAWAASAPAGSTINLFYDTDTDPSSGLVLIANHLEWDLFSKLWVCAAVPEGEYYIYAELHDGASMVYDYSDGTIVIEHDPLFVWITSPGASGDQADRNYFITWLAEGPADRVIDLFYDTDKDPSSGLLPIVSDLPSPLHSNEYEWICLDVPEGTYYILGVLWDSAAGGDSTSHYSVGALTIQHD